MENIDNKKRKPQDPIESIIAPPSSKRINTQE